MRSIVILILFIACACHHSVKDVGMIEEESIARFGAVYISCETPPWKCSVDGLLSCEQDQLAVLELNPSNACAFSTIMDDEGELEIRFSDDITLGRIEVRKLSSEIMLLDQNQNTLEQLFLDEMDYFFIEAEEIKLKVRINNAYVGGCFHELIRWEEVL